MSALDTFLEPADWPLAHQVLPLLQTALLRMELGGEFAQVAIVLDECAADERAWLQLAGHSPRRRLTLWLHPDLFLHERPRPWTGGPDSLDWELGPAPTAMAMPSIDDFSLLNTQRTLYQQLLLVRDLLKGLLRPKTLTPELGEAFQEAWLVTIDGRLQRSGLPHLSAARRRLRFLHVFAHGAVLTPYHWATFNQLWESDEPDQASVIAKIRSLPTLRRRLNR